MKENISPISCITEFVFYKTCISKADLILIPGSDDPELAIVASEILLNGYAPQILISGGKNLSLQKWNSEAEFLQAICIENGVVPCQIKLEQEARNTFENAKFSYKILQKVEMKVKRVILVCRAFHSRRAWLTYKTVFPKSVEIMVYPIKGSVNITPENWYIHQESINIVMKEVEKIGGYFKSEIEKLNK